MNGEKINFNKIKEDENGKKFEFMFEGIISNENFDKEKIDESIDKFVNNKNHKNMIQNVSFIRTILKDCKENLLIVKYNDNNFQEMVRYNKGNLFLFDVKNKVDNDLAHANFTLGKGLNVYFPDLSKSTIDYSNDSINEKFNKLTNHIYLLKNANCINIDLNCKMLIETYKLFYNEEPDFSDSNINIRIQTMIFLLQQFGISLDDNYSFSLLGKYKIPLSLKLEQFVNKLFPLGKVYDDNLVEIPEDSKKTIKIVGECVRNKIKKEKNKDIYLMIISKVAYIVEYNLSSNVDSTKLSELTNYTQNEVESSIKLLKRIKNKLKYTSD